MIFYVFVAFVALFLAFPFDQVARATLKRRTLLKTTGRYKIAISANSKRGKK